MKRKGYRYGVWWIAENDEPDEMHIDAVEQQITVLLLADLFVQSPAKVAYDVVEERLRAFDCRWARITLSDPQRDALQQRCWDDDQVALRAWDGESWLLFERNHARAIAEDLLEAINAEHDAADQELVGDISGARRCARSLEAIHNKVLRIAQEREATSR